MCIILTCICTYINIQLLGIAVTGAFEITADLVSSNQIADYEFVAHDVMLDPSMAILRCASGLGPSGSDMDTVLGGWYFNGAQLFVPSDGSGCDQSGSRVFLVRGANTRNYPGVINLHLCGTFTTTEEGVYECRMMNSSMMVQTTRVGVYFSRRSESLDMYHIMSLLIIFHLSIQLLQL